MKQTLGMVIAILRKEKGMLQFDFAKKMGVTNKTISKWVKDLSCPDVNPIVNANKRALSILVSVIMVLSIMPSCFVTSWALARDYNSIGFVDSYGNADDITNSSESSINWFNPQCMDLRTDNASRTVGGVTITRNNSYTLTFNGTFNTDAFVCGVMPFSVKTGETYTIDVRLISGTVNTPSVGGWLVLEYTDSLDESLSPRANFDFRGTKTESKTMTADQASSIKGIKFSIWKGDRALSFSNAKFEIRIIKGTNVDLCNPSNMALHAGNNATLPSKAIPTKPGYKFVGYYDSPTEGTLYYNSVGTPDRTINGLGKVILYARWTPKVSSVFYNYNDDGQRGENLFNASGLGEFTYCKNGVSFTKLDSNGNLRLDGDFSSDFAIYDMPISLEDSAYTLSVNVTGGYFSGGDCVFEFYDSNGNQLNPRVKVDTTSRSIGEPITFTAEQAKKCARFKVWL